MTKVTQLNSIRNTLQSALNSRTLVDIETNIETGNGEFNGFIIKLSNQFAMLHVISDWHCDGVLIIPIVRISSITPCNNHDERKQILIWNGLETSTRYSDINIEDFETVFASIQSKNGIAVVEDFESVEIGKVIDFENKSLVLKGINGAGEWLEDQVVRPFSDIWHVIFDDEYSKVLGAYLDRGK